ncbi:hypothetical protein NHX12_003221 [Muraenolepis orangiensis]|uniref:Activin types I and II receptor domain-containing protein n=1 Tax=Muraenolepis orangiensis TaxID=630683 RepID=A0A9Q0DZY9_9TELE|nr:hypothetical protein NHX12_003221 [Muraenolepis orangiensis]
MDVTALNATLSGTSAPEEAAAGRPVFYTLGALGALVLASLVACLVVVARLRFADDPEEEWEKVMWSDETKIELFGINSTRRVWRKKKDEYNPKNTIPTVKHGELPSPRARHVMESQKKESRPGCYHLASALLVVVAALLVLPGSLSSDTLLCNYCPMQHRSKSCTAAATTTKTSTAANTTRCLADERCASSQARYGGLHVLSEQGCLAAVLCGTHEVRAYRGTSYNVSYACCCEDRCNHRRAAPPPEAYLKTLLGALLRHAHFRKLTNNVTRAEERARDSLIGVSEALSIALLLRLWLLPRPLLADNLRCFYSPLMERELEDQFQLVVTECPPGELCFNGEGRYGNLSLLSVRGCMAPDGGCGGSRDVRFKGTEYVLSFTCCSQPHCNAAPAAFAPPARSLALSLVAVFLGLALF